MDSIYRDAMPDVFATVEFDPEDLKIDVSMFRIEDEPNVEISE